MLFNLKPVSESFTLISTSKMLKDVQNNDFNCYSTSNEIVHEPYPNVPLKSNIAIIAR